MPNDKRSGDSDSSLPELNCSEEDCLKALARLAFEDSLDDLTPGQVAKTMQVQSKSIAGVLKSLNSKGYIVHKPYSGAKLTERGRPLAIRLLRAHRLLETMLFRTLNVPWDQIHADADRLEHSVSDDLLHHLDRLLDFPAHDPHGDPIPDANGKWRNSPSSCVPLADCATNQDAKISRIVNQQPDFLKFIQASGLMIDVIVTVLANDPVAGILSITLAKETISLGSSVAASILVEPISEIKSHN